MKNSNKLFAILLVFIAIFFGSTMGMLMKIAQDDLNVFTAGFFRFFLGLIIILPFILKTKFKVYKTKNLKIHIIRSLLNLPAMLIGFAALTMVTLEKISALNFVVPLFVTILAVIFLKEKIRMYRMSALIIGFIGMLVILRPGIIDVSLGIQMTLLSSFIWSIVIIITKKLTKNDSSITILTYQYTNMTFLSLVFVFFFWQTPSPISLFYLFLASLSGTIFHLCMNHVYKLSDVTMTQPYSFFGLIVASVYGYLIFGEVPDIYTWIGGVIIFISVTLITVREIQLNKDIVRNKININS
jgi:drug/metabolite transporter (DMT)-like permease